MVLEVSRGGNGVANAITSPPSYIPLSARVSMEDYYQQRGGSLDLLDAPPSYDAFLLQPTNSRKYNIQPREDEGREILPSYSSAISLECVFMRKLELEGAVHRAQDRNWNKVIATLQGTALSFHKYKGPGPFQMVALGNTSPDMPAGAKRGVLMKSYNLQHADVGIAADYYKKRYVIRVRAEADQFLLSCLKIETFVLWLQSLFAAIDLAPPLDDRQIPRDLSIPRPRRRRAARTTQTNMERNAALVAEQQEILRTQYPRLADTPIAEDEGNEDDTDIPSEEAAPVRPPPSTNTSSSSSSSSNSLPNTTALISRARAARAARNLVSSSAPNPSIQPETGKWQPHHQWTPLYDMQYAKRCMAVLTSRSPRKTNFVIMKGKQWIVDWATGALTRWEPPEYGEVAGEGEGERPSSRRLRINQHGEVLAV